MICVGIDPGAKGSLCVIDTDTNDPVYFCDFNLRNYIDTLRDIKSVWSENPELSVVIMVAVEKVHAMPGQGVSSCFTFGQRLGELEGILMSLDIPYELVSPKDWQKTCGIPSKSDKKAIANILSKLYPQALLYGTKGGLLDGRSDALGLAHYIRLKYKGNINESINNQSSSG